MNTTTKTVIGIAAVMMIAAAVAVKVIWYPSVKDIWFLGNGRQLRQVPAGILVIRPTRFSNAPTNAIVSNNVNGQQRMAGRNVTLQMLFAAAYPYNPGRVFVPADAPKKNYDFLCTVPQDRFKDALTRETGFAAHVETRDADVLTLTVEDPNSSGLTVSAPDEPANSKFKNGRLYFTHVRVQDVAGGLEGILKTPVVDKTGLTNFFDFSMAWNRNMRPNNLTKDQLGKILGEWGLGLEPGNESVEMLVVKKWD